MKYIILGLLLNEEMTIYEMIVTIKKFMGSICSASTGSIKSAISLLMTQEAITVHDEHENGRDKKVYAITEIGRIEFNNWMAFPMQTGKSKNMELGKLFFLGLVDVKTAKSGIANYIEQLSHEYQELNQLKNYQEIKGQLDVVGKNQVQDVTVKDDLDKKVKYQLLTLKYGMDALAFEIEWYKKLYKDMEKMENE